LFIFLVIYLFDKLRHYHEMTREEIRRDNARQLARGVGGHAEFARFMSMEASQVSQLIGRNPVKNIGNSIARRIEQAFDLPTGYLDEEHSQTSGERWKDGDSPTPALNAFSEAIPVTIDASTAAMIPIKRVALSLRAGVLGFDANQINDEDTTIDIPRQFIEENNLVPQCLLAINIKGDSMHPLMIDGDVVVINIADTRPINGELYAINFRGEPVVKRMVREGNEWYLESVNPAPEFHRRICRGGDCIVVGRVVRQEARKLIGRI